MEAKKCLINEAPYIKLKINLRIEKITRLIIQFKWNGEPTKRIRESFETKFEIDIKNKKIIRKIYIPIKQSASIIKINQTNK